MTLAELLKTLVETEDQMERMTLVEQNQNLMTPEVGETEEGEAEPGEDWEAKYNELKKKYIDTFFSGSKEEEGEGEAEQPPEDTEKQRAETITTDDLLKEGKK